MTGLRLKYERNMLKSQRMYYFNAILVMICLFYLISQRRKKRTKKEEIKHDDNELKTTLIVPYSCDVIMNILTDFCRYDHYVPDIVESTVYERSKNIHKARFVTRVLFLHITSYIEHTIKYNEISWRLDPNFKDIFFQENYGSWVVTPIGVNQSRINYRVKMNAILPFSMTWFENRLFVEQQNGL